MTEEERSEENEIVEEQPKKESIVGFLIAIVLVSVIAIGAGWFVGGQLQKPESSMENIKQATTINEKKKNKDTKKKEDDKKEGEDKKPKAFVILDPMLVELAHSNDSWLRLEIALLVDSEAGLDSAENKLMVNNDLTAFIRTVSLSQISGPSGYIHFREDLIDRAKLATKGMVKDVIIVSMVAE